MKRSAVRDWNWGFIVLFVLIAAVVLLVVGVAVSLPSSGLTP